MRTAVADKTRRGSAAVTPMLCTLVAEPFDNPDWIFEPKFDGLRILAQVDDDEVNLISRNQVSQNFQFPDIVEAVRDAIKQPALLDGEVVCLDEQGRSSFRALQQRFHLESAREVEARRQRFPAYLYLFDVLNADGRDVTKRPLNERKEILRELVRWSDRVRWTEFATGNGREQYHKACREGSEGIVAKHKDSAYVSSRSGWWVKIKCTGRQEFVVGGFTDPQRSRVGLGALLVGYYSDDGKRLNYAGKVGTGYTRQTLLDLRKRLEEIQQRRSPFDAGYPPTGPGVHWVEPKLVAEIAFAEWTQNGLLRQPRFEGLRPDKKPRECRRERPAPPTRSNKRAEGHSPAPPISGGTTMPLDEYKANRDFRVTSEPPAKVAKAHRKPIFVVQEHHASRLHYDFRLEADGVLKSWAVPKQPSMDPSQKRLAIHVEDHPLDYARFEGTIPKGEYGAGTVRIWDSGTYENLLEDKPAPLSASEAIDAGRLEFELHGRKLQGRFALIRMRGRGQGKENWLLIKMKDDLARPEAPSHANGHAAKAKPKARLRLHRTAAPDGELEFSNTGKIMFPEAGITKGDLIEFYRRIAPNLLPFLRDRPATLERLPNGLAQARGPHFWQKDIPDSYPSWIPRVELPTERGKAVRYALVNDLDTLLYLVNQGTLTFHVWFSRVEDLDRPDFVLFDLDPGQASFADAVAVANELHSHLDDEGVDSFVKTSGKSGLHVLVPWRAEGGHDEARSWALRVAERVVESLPGQATTERSKSKRAGRVYVDVMQNARGHHAVPPYVVRAVPEATVSTPLEWRELTPKLTPSEFTINSIFRRLAKQKSDPMARLLGEIAPAKRKIKSR